MVGPPALPAVSPPRDNVRVQSDLAFRLPVQASDRPHAGGRAAMGFDDRDQSRDCSSGCGTDVAGRGDSLSVRASPDHADGGFGWRLAILRPASVRAYALV